MPRRTRQDPDRGDARSRLLAAAVDIIRAHGFAATSVDDLCRAAGVPASAKRHLLEGVNDKVLTAFVASKRASVLVMGTVGRTGLAGLIVGNTAERVLRQVRCSIVALKPAGFAEATPEGATARTRARS